jgi:hypothetical protein
MDDSGQDMVLIDQTDKEDSDQGCRRQGEGARPVCRHVLTGFGFAQL